MTPRDDLIRLASMTIELQTREIKQLQDDLATKNYMLQKALIDVAISQQVIGHLKEQGELLRLQVEKIKQLYEVKP